MRKKQVLLAVFVFPLSVLALMAGQASEKEALAEAQRAQRVNGGSVTGRGQDQAQEVLEQISFEVLDFPGRVGVCARHFGTGEEVRYLAEEKFPTASSIKTPVMVEFFCQQAEGKIFLDDPCVVLDEEKVGGSGTLQDATGPVRATYREMIELMITISDNTATNEVVDGVGGLWDGIHAINNRMKTFGLKHTKLLNKMMWYKTKTKAPDSLRYGVGVTTPQDLVRLYEMLYRGEIVNRAVCDEMLAVLLRQKYNSMIPGQLPLEQIPEIRVAHKTGSVGDAVIDAGIVYTPRGDYGIALFADGTGREDWPGEKAAIQELATLSRIVFDHFFGANEQGQSTKDEVRGNQGKP